MRLIERLKSFKVLWELSRGIKVVTNKKYENVIFLVKTEENCTLSHIRNVEKTLGTLKNINIIYMDASGNTVAKFKQ